MNVTLTRAHGTVVVREGTNRGTVVVRRGTTMPVVVRGGATKPVWLAARKVPVQLGRSGRSGPAGPEGPRGLPGEIAGDPGDLTLIFDNKLI